MHVFWQMTDIFFSLQAKNWIASFLAMTAKRQRVARPLALSWRAKRGNPVREDRIAYCLAVTAKSPCF
jgi:hypothetical protein